MHIFSFHVHDFKSRHLLYHKNVLFSEASCNTKSWDTINSAEINDVIDTEEDSRLY